MKSSWQVSRHVIARDDGQRRWDYAYQFLLQWAMDSEARKDSVPLHPQEDSHGNRSVCPGIDQSAAADSDD